MLQFVAASPAHNNNIPGTRMKLTTLIIIACLLQLTGCASLGIGNRPMAELTEKYTDHHSKFIAVDDLIVHYRDQGDGPVLLLLHGVASSLHTWDAWAERLQDRYRVIRLDLPAHGLTGPDPKRKRYDIDYMVSVLDTFVRELQLPPFVLAGNSLGGYISWNYALHHPQNVEKLILIDAAGYPQKMPFIMSMAAWPVMGEMSTLMMPRFIVGSNIRAAYGDSSKVDKALVRRYHDLTLREGNRRGLMNVFRTMKEQSRIATLGDRVQEVNTPTLLMWGEEDTWVPLTILERFRQDLPNVQVITYEGVGHMPMEEIPNQTARDAHAFIEGSYTPAAMSQVE
ncbi:MAG: alpha/beta hydrolase [Bacterioplanes sp.]|nr:alpha/beta hydrolase [Bacterioplanes sp.]